MGENMSTQDNIEKVLRNLHVLLSKSEPYTKEPTKVIVDKQLMLDLLTQLNKCVYDIMDEYELTKQSRDRAEREFQKKGSDIIWNASRNAEDIYAASVMYTNEALNHIQDIMKEANASVEAIYAEMSRKLKEEQQQVKTNQLELKSQLQDLRDTEKYMKLIEQRNKELQKEKEAEKPIEQIESNVYANRQTEIKINQEYFEKVGIAMENLSVEEEKKEVEVDIKIDLDADYFQWKEEQENKNKVSKEKADRFQSILKGLTSGRNS